MFPSRMKRNDVETTARETVKKAKEKEKKEKTEESVARIMMKERK